MPPPLEQRRPIALRDHHPLVNWRSYQRYREGGNFVWGQVRGENFVFQFGVEIFPTNFFVQYASFSMESQPGLCSFL